MDIKKFNLAVCRFQTQFPLIPIEENFSFAKRTTIGCGGYARLAVSPKNVAECAEILRYFEQEEIPYCFLGAGANVLPCDGVFQGVVVRFHLMRKLKQTGDLVYAGAGVTGGALCRFMRDNAFGGFEALTGIPMSVGGATAMNAGVAEGHISDRIVGVIGVKDGQIITLSKADCQFSVKQSIFQRGIAVAGVFLRGKLSTREEIEKKTAYFRDKRCHLPKGRSMGCTFVNVGKTSAGALIESCGLKGLAFGGARVSEEHANFIINEGGCANDVYRLIQAVKLNVSVKTGITLKEEIKYLPNRESFDT